MHTMNEYATERTPHGQFAKGNPGGPGRPRRAIERDYVAAIADVCTLERWRQVTERAVSDAIAGDAKAREFLARYLVGDKPRGLTDLAVKEAGGVTAEDEVQAGVLERQKDAARQAQYDSVLRRFS
jgi:hypothetical protein